MTSCYMAKNYMSYFDKSLLKSHNKFDSFLQLEYVVKQAESATHAGDLVSLASNQKRQ